MVYFSFVVWSKEMSETNGLFCAFENCNWSTGVLPLHMHVSLPVSHTLQKLQLVAVSYVLDEKLTVTANCLPANYLCMIIQPFFTF